MPALLAAALVAASPPLYNLSLAQAVAHENGLRDVDALVARAEKFDDGDRFLVLSVGLAIGGGVHLATTVPSTGLIAGFNVWPGYLAIGGAGLVGVVGLALLSVALEFFDRPTGF